MTNTSNLVLKIVEINLETKNVENVFYIFYDREIKHYVIKGKRMKEDFVCNPYSYLCQSLELSQMFIEVVISEENNIIYDLFNHENLTTDSVNITYESLEKTNKTHLNEVVVFIQESYDSKKLKKLLDVIKNVYNY